MALWVIMLLNCPIFTSLCYPPPRKVCKHGGRATNLRFPSIIYSQLPLSELWVSCRQNTRDGEPQLPTGPVVTSHLNNNLTTHRAHSWELTTQACQSQDHTVYLCLSAVPISFSGLRCFSLFLHLHWLHYFHAFLALCCSSLCSSPLSLRTSSSFWPACSPHFPDVVLNRKNSTVLTSRPLQKSITQWQQGFPLTWLAGQHRRSPEREIRIDFQGFCFSDCQPHTVTHAHTQSEGTLMTFFFLTECRYIHLILFYLHSYQLGRFE